MNDYYVNGYHARRPWYSSEPFDSRFLQSLYPTKHQETETSEPENLINKEYEPELPEYEEDLVEDIRSFETSTVLSTGGYETSPSTANTVTHIAGAVNLREAVLVSLGGAGAALALLAAMAALLLARRRKSGSSPSPTPPILVYPPHDMSAPCFLTKEINFSLPALRSCSMGELRDDVMSDRGVSGSAGILSPCGPPQLRSNSYTNTYDLGVLDPALYKPDCLDEDLLWPDGHVGRVWFTLKYDSNTERLQVHLMKAKHLPSRNSPLANACDPLIKVQLLPDERRVLRTKQKKSCNPTFDETFIYQVPARNLDTLILKLSVLDTGKKGRDKQLIGHVLLPLSELEASSPDEEPQLFKLDIEKEIQEPTSNFGELLVSMLYNENLHRLTVTVIEARGLKLDTVGAKHEVAVRVTQARACRGVRARRTAAVEMRQDGGAQFLEFFHFRLKTDELHTTSVTFHAIMPNHPYAKDRVIGKFVLGSYMFARGKALQHWNSAISAPMEQIKQWHPLTN